MFTVARKAYEFLPEFIGTCTFWCRLLIIGSARIVNLAFKADNTKRIFSATPLASAGLFALSGGGSPLRVGESGSLYPGIEVDEDFRLKTNSAGWNRCLPMRGKIARALKRFLPVRAE